MLFDVSRIVYENVLKMLKSTKKKKKTRCYKTKKNELLMYTTWVKRTDVTLN